MNVTLHPVHAYGIPADLVTQGAREHLSFPSRAEYHLIHVDGDLAGVTGIWWRSGYAIFKSHLVMPRFRRRGVFAHVLDWSIARARERNMRYVEATCTPASLPAYLRAGARVTHQYRLFTKVRIDLT